MEDLFQLGTWLMVSVRFLQNCRNVKRTGKKRGVVALL